MSICCICNSDLGNSEKLFPREMRQGRRIPFEYIYCHNCKCLIIKNPPYNLAEFYSDYYTSRKTYNHISVFKSKLWKLRSKLVLGGLYPIIRLLRKNSILEWLSKIDIRFSDPILDVGCGNGDVLFEFNKHGFINLSGVDPYPPSRQSNEFKWTFYKGDIFSIIDQKYKLIMFNHSLEHTMNHEMILTRAKELLYENGTILVRMPIINKVFESYKENWVQIDAPRHLLIHSLKSFELLCEKLELRISKIIFDSTEFQFLGSEQNSQNISFFDDISYKVNPQKSIFKSKDIARYKELANRYNKLKIGDQAAFLLKIKPQFVS
jgi:2-polyprenyl-3-methyl-5-hydroxy-6-metoxy-1,4-benzoquinol methylase